MDCKPEWTGRTFLRIEALLLQGVLHSLLHFGMLVVAIPLAAIWLAKKRYETATASHGWLVCLLLSPWWLLLGLGMAIAVPFIALADEVSVMGTLMRAEWEGRWLAAHPKRPSGKPIDVAMFQAQREVDESLEVERDVIKDYAWEAALHGDFEWMPIAKATGNGKK